MFARNWRARLPLLIWLLVAQLNTGDGQSQNAIGAHRSFQRTSFSCSGRPSGYYADVETGCQVYHMCDTLGRQFSYSCPNTTLFQQRMLICDHWYMVNCSKAESDYAANLLIGQRDKPFVNDEENSQRTPRPDLLDRPYAPDYSGESFRNQYKSLPAAPNQIVDSNAEKNVDKVAAASQPAPGQQRWKIPPPSRSILPPSLEPHTEADTHGFSDPDSSRFIKPPVAKPTAVKAVSTTRRPVATAFAAPQRGQTASADEHDDLGTSHSTRYNTSADFNSAEVSPPSKPNKRRPGNTSAAKPAAVKIPSKIYEPPFLHPIYNQDNASSTMEPLRVSIATPFAAHASKPPVATTTTRPPTRLTTLAGKPFTPSVLSASTSAAPQFAIHTSPSQYPRTPTPAQGFKPPTPSPPVDATQTSRPPNSASDFSSSPDLAAIKPTEPARDLLPPFPDFVQHDIATTVGPPIYYEWKVPSNGLEPPKLDPPIGVDGREYPDSDFDYNAISAVGPTPATTFGSDRKNAAAELPKKLAQGNPFLVSTPQPPTESTTVRTPASRSVKETAQAGAIATTSSQDSAAPTDASDITKLRQDLSVPEFLFPLEDIGRTGYLASDTYNSFQLKIPEQHSDNEAGPQHWFGENPKCPECHPSYVTPGTCEPCVRR